MKNRKIVSLLGTIATSVCVILVSGNAASAGTLRNGWNYASDSSSDSTERIDANNTAVGGTVFEIFGMAIKQDADNIYVALNANLPREGVRGDRSVGASLATDRHIGWGDLFFNFSGDNLSTASTNRSLFGIRFGVPSNSGVSTTGVYRNVKAKSVAGDNAGWSTLRAYLNTAYPNTVGLQNASAGDLRADDPYFSQDNLTSIDSGDKIGDITVLNSGQLSGLGLDFGTSGSQTFGLKFAKSLFPSGNFTASLVTECFNDSIALVRNIESQPVPESSSILSLTAIGLLFGGNHLHKRCKNSSVK